VKEYPILFSGPMVRAILEGRKTQTRRVTKHNTDFLNYAKNQFVKNGEWYPTTPSGKVGLAPAIKCPYGKPGDRLSVYTNNIERWFGVCFASPGLTIEVIKVSIERINDISNNDAVAEGTPDLRTKENNWDMARCFREFWVSIKGENSWAANPFVWVIEFKKVI